MTPKWNRKLARPVGYIKPTRGRMVSLSDARAYLVSLGPRERLPAWQHAAQLLMDAAGGGDIEAVTKQIELALMHDAALDVRAA